MSELRERELRDLLERASDIGGEVDVDDHWFAGRRRRTRRSAGIAAVGGVAAVVVAGGLAQTGLLGGSGTTPTGPAAVPDDLETFVFAAPEAVGEPDGSAALRAASAEDLAGTRWVLQDGMWQAGSASAELTGTGARTFLTFAQPGEGRGWGVSVGGCGGAGMQDLVVDDRGRFSALEVSSDDQGCPDDVQAAEDFWIESLSGGGQLTLLDDGRWLLLSVDAPAPVTPGPTDEPSPSVTDGDVGPTDGSTAPATDEGTVAPTDSGTAEPTEGGTGAPPTGEAPVPPEGSTAPPTSVAAPPAGPAFVDPGQELVDQPWPGAGGELFAPTVRAGVHEGFDRVVVDLTGTGDPGWRAAYTDDPRLDGSGFASDIAGDSVLELRLTGMGYPEPGSDVYSEGTFGLDTHTLDAVVEVHRSAPFEGMLQVFVGMHGEPRPYRVFLLQDPMRLVIDVRTGP